MPRTAIKNLPSRACPGGSVRGARRRLQEGGRAPRLSSSRRGRDHASLAASRCRRRSRRVPPGRARLFRRLRWKVASGNGPFEERLRRRGHDFSAEQTALAAVMAVASYDLEARSMATADRCPGAGSANPVESNPEDRSFHLGLSAALEGPRPDGVGADAVWALADGQPAVRRVIPAVIAGGEVLDGSSADVRLRSMVITPSRHGSVSDGISVHVAWLPATWVPPDRQRRRWRREPASNN